MSLLEDVMRLLGMGSRHPPETRAREDLLSSLLVMAWVVEARDPYTGGHLWRVSRFARLLASDIGLSDQEVSRVAVGGFLHDLGKVGVPDAILNKPGRLTGDEYEIIKTHPDVGWRMLAGHPLASMVEVSVRSHHERPDGTGYPRGLRGFDIPQDARIVGICDAFDAMTSARPYRSGMAIDKALAIVEDGCGGQFDGSLGARFVVLGRAGALDHIAGHSDEGIPLYECVMCGPTLVLRRGQGAGERIYCRNCGGEYRVAEEAEGMAVTPTGNKGTPEDLEPVADVELIARIVRESARAML